MNEITDLNDFLSAVRTLVLIVSITVHPYIDAVLMEDVLTVVQADDCVASIKFAKSN